MRYSEHECNETSWHDFVFHLLLHGLRCGVSKVEFIQGFDFVRLDWVLRKQTL